MGSKRLSIREKRRKQIQQQRILTILGVALVALIIAGVLIGPSILREIAPVGEITTPEAFAYPNPDMNSIGDPNAPVKIVEYSDFQCPFCRVFFETTEKQLIETYISTGQVYFTYRSMGNWLGQESFRAAEAAYCAGDQGKFWDYHAILFVNQGGENQGVYTDKRLSAMAETLGLDMVAFNECLEGNKYEDRVNQDRIDGLAAGVEGTPAFLVNDKLIPGAVDFPTLQREIEAILSAGN
jgi:protein-disulfide isomerase